MRCLTGGALAVTAIEHLGRAPLVASGAMLAALAMAILPNRWTAGAACASSLMLAQGTEGWVAPIAAAMFLIAPRNGRGRWFRIASTAAVAVMWGASVASGIGVADFWKSAGAGGVAAFAALHLLLVNPAWIGAAMPGVVETVFYDGHCGLCHHTVKFLIGEDSDGSRFRFAPLDSDAFRRAVPEEARRSLPDSVVVMSEGAPLVRSRAALHALARLGGWWRVVAWIGRIPPRPLADWTYDRIARVRHRIFARPADVCPLIPAELRGRFIR